MANSKKTNTPASAVPAIDLAAFLPEGMDNEELVDTGGLRPIVQADTMMEHPVAGWLIAVLDMPPREDKSPWRAILVETTGATRAKVGEDTNVPVEAGCEVLIPLSGNLANNSQLLDALADDASMSWGIFQTQGQVNVGKPSPMWDIKVRLHPKPKARTGKYLRHTVEAQFAASRRPTQLGRGEVQDTNGKAVTSMVGG